MGYCSIEIEDESGESEIRHLVLTESQKREILEEGIRQGRKIAIYELTPEQVLPALDVVKLEYDDIKRLVGGP